MILYWTGFIARGLSLVSRDPEWVFQDNSVYYNLVRIVFTEVLVIISI